MSYEKIMGGPTNGAYDLCSMLGLTCYDYDGLTDDAREAVEEIYDELTVFDERTCNRFWRNDVDEEATHMIYVDLAPRIFDDDGNPRLEAVDF